MVPSCSNLLASIGNGAESVEAVRDVFVAEAGSWIDSGGVLGLSDCLDSLGSSSTRLMTAGAGEMEPG